MNEEIAVIKAVMTSKNDNNYYSHMEIKGTERDILNLLSDITGKLIISGVDFEHVMTAFLSGILEKANGAEEDD